MAVLNPILQAQRILDAARAQATAPKPILTIPKIVPQPAPVIPIKPAPAPAPLPAPDPASVAVRPPNPAIVAPAPAPAPVPTITVPLPAVQQAAAQPQEPVVVQVPRESVPPDVASGETATRVDVPGGGTLVAKLATPTTGVRPGSPLASIPQWAWLPIGAVALWGVYRLVR